MNYNSMYINETKTKGNISDCTL